MLKQTVLIALLIFLSSPAYAVTQWCDDSTAVVCAVIEEGSGTTTDDASSNNHTMNFEASGEPAWDSGDVPSIGSPGSTWSVDLDGSNDNINIASVSTLNISGNMTMVIWASVDGHGSGGDQDIMFRHGDSNQDSYVLEFADGDIIWGINTVGAGKQTYETSGGVAGSGWIHWAGTYDGTTAIVYRDGSNVQDDLKTWTQDSGDFTLNIGGRTDSAADCFEGNLDEVAVFSETKDATDINDIMDNGLVQTVAGVDATVIRGDTVISGNTVIN